MSRKVVRAWRRIDRHEEQFAERERHRSRHLHLYQDDDGMYVLRGRLPAEVGAVLERALAAASEALYDQQSRQQPASTDVSSYTQRQADAIGLLAEWALGGASAPAVQPEVVDSTSAWTSAVAHALCRRPSVARWSTGTSVADFQGAACGFATRITSLTGPTAAKRNWRISSCFVGGIIALCTRKASVQRCQGRERCPSRAQMVGRCRTRRPRHNCRKTALTS
jgi:hypothetical protein